MRRLAVQLFALLLVVSSALAHGADLVDAARLDAIARPLVNGGWVAGLSVGLIDARGTQLAGYGHIADNDASAPSGDTIFEIGSISKVFTGLLLASMVEDHTVALDDPVQKLLGDSMTVPTRNDRAITLVDLATHTSGLPRMPTNFTPKDPSNPYADYTVEQMGHFVSHYTLHRDPGQRNEYSNLGMGLLGHALALKSGMSYEALLLKRICDPLAMADTRITLDDAQKQRLAQPHDFDGNVVANWDIPTLAGAGAIRSTAVDMLRFVAANAGLASTPLDAAVAEAERVHFKAPNGDNDLGLAWHIRRANQVVWHNGQTGGYHAFVAVAPDKRAGVVLLANSATLHVDAVGFRLLELLLTGSAKPLEIPVEVAADSAALARVVGKYQLGLGIFATVTRQDEKLLIQLTGQPKIRLYPLSSTGYFCRAVEAQFSFAPAEGAADDAPIQRLTIHQNGQDVVATKAE